MPHREERKEMIISAGRDLFAAAWKWCGSSFSVILVLLWDYLMYLQAIFLKYFIVQELYGEYKGNSNDDGIALSVVYYVFFLSFPLFCLIADVWIGRHRTIMIGASLCFLSWILGGLQYLINSFYALPKISILLISGTSILINYAGYGIFKATIVQYNIDQLVGASTSLLDAVIYCHSGVVPVGYTLLLLLRCTTKYQFFTLLSFFVPGLFVSLMLVSHSLFKHKLENISLIKNPVKLIARVLCYAKKHKYPENRSALTYWEEKAPSRLDLGKEFYGGPFTEEEVEDVKTVFRMIPLLISLIAQSAAYEVYQWIMTGSNNVNTINSSSCFISTEFPSYLTSVVMFMLYMFPIRLFCQQYIPNMLSMQVIGLFLTLIEQLSKMTIFIYYRKENDPETQFIQPILILPQILQGLMFAFIVPVSLEFIIAQSPLHMRGTMVGMWIASIGIGFLFNINLKYPFGCNNKYICTSYYYYLAKSILILVILIVFVILAKRYKYRVRQNEYYRPIREGFYEQSEVPETGSF
uniref:Major facilitator superfamily (MFS) profile domain-containing protein n=1 Tax=Amphimedon queenslandica TaxID=400682 RepID=A0A1X7VN31_AMPQE